MVVATLPEYDIQHKGRSRRRCCSSRIAFIVSTVILALITTCLITLIIIHVFFHRLYKEESDLCRSKQCTVTSSMLIESMDPTVDPCSDFYQFSCGGFIRKNLLPDGDGNTADVFEQHKRDIIHQLNDVIKKVDPKNQPKVIGKAQHAYSVCVNGSKNEDEEFKAFRNFIKKTLGGWPLATGSSWKLKDSLGEFLGKVTRLGYSIQLLNIKIGADMLEPSLKRIMFEQPTMDVIASKTFRRRKRDVDSDSDFRRNLQPRLNFITGVANLLGNTNNTGIAEDYAEMIRLEFSLEGLSTDEHEPKNYTQLYNKLTLNQVNKLTRTKIDWIKLLNVMFQKDPPFTENDEVVVTSLEYMTKLSIILEKFSKRAIVNTIIWKIIYSLAEHAGPKLDNLYYQYQKNIHGISTESSRWNLCLSWVNDAFAFALTRIFAQQYIDDKAIKTAEDFVILIQKAYRKSIERSRWLDNETKRRALIKVDLMKRFIGYPEFIFDDEKLESYFSYISTISNVHFSNVVNIMTETIQQFLETYTKPVDRETWTENPTDVNAFYEAQTNSIWFPAGVLNKPFFDDKRLAAVNFGIIGSLIGHEIGHGFDNEGSQFDETGRLQQWWSSRTMQEFVNRTKCYVNQYNEYCPEELMDEFSATDPVCINGNVTLAENIADNTGIQCAYDAYKMWIKENGEENRLPGLEEYSPHQIFFISYAYMWCENVPPEYWLAIYEDDNHSSGKYRVIGSLANMEEFSKVFECNKGPMNHGDKRCTLW